MNSSRKLRFGVRNIWQAASSILVVLVGATALLSWAFNLPVLRMWVLGSSATKPNTALSLVLVGTALWLLRQPSLSPRRRQIAQVCAGIAGIIGLVTLAEYLFGWQPGIDEFLFRDAVLSFPSALPGRMTAATAICLLLTCLSVWLVTRDERPALAQCFALVVVGIGLFVLISALYGGVLLNGIFAFASLAFPTTVALLLIGLNLLLIRPHQGWMAVFSADASGGRMARILLPAVIIMPVVIGWLVFVGQAYNLYSDETEIVIFAMANIILFALLVGWGAHVLNRTDAENQQAAMLIRRLNRTLGLLSDINQAIVRVREMPTLFEHTCQIAIRNQDFTAAWIALYDPATQQLTLAADAGLSDEFRDLLLHAMRHMTQEGEHFAAVLRTHNRRVFNDFQNDPQIPPVRREAAQRFGYQSTVLLPLLIGGEVRGMFSLYARDRDYFDHDELKLIDEMAGDLAFAMEFADQDSKRQQAESELRFYAQRMELLHEIDTNLIRGESVQVLVETALKHLRQLVPCQRAQVALLDEGGETGIIFALDHDGDTTLQQGQHLPVGPDFGADFDERGLRVVDDTRPFLDTISGAKALAREGLVCKMSVLMKDQDRPIGSLGLMASEPGFFTEAYQEVAAEVADQLAIAIRQLRLSEQLAQHTADLERSVVEIQQGRDALREANETLEERVTERTLELSRSKEQVEAILDNSTEGIALVDADLRIRQANPAFDLLFLREADDSEEDSSLLDFIYPDDAARLEALARLVSTERIGNSIEVRCTRTDASVFEAEFSIGYVSAVQGREGYVCSVRDITERKYARLALMQSEQRFRSLVAAAPVATVITDQAGIIQLVNEQSEQLFGYDAVELVGQPVEKLLPASLRGQHVQHRAQYVAAPRVRPMGRNLELFALRKDGSQFPTEIELSYVETDSGLLVIAFIVDITERKQAEQALEAKIQEEREFQTYLKELHEIGIELTQVDEMDEFYRYAVAYGRERLGFERLALFLYDPETALALGTFGTDTLGQMTDERGFSFEPDPTGTMARALRRTERFCYDEVTPLYHNEEQVGVGWNAAAVLWNGTHSLGWLIADNAISHRSATKPQLDILALYALTLGTLLGQMRARVALRESETRYRLLAENISDLVARIDANGTYLYVSPSSREVLGYEPEELIGQPSMQLVHPHDAGRLVDLQASAQVVNAPTTSITYRVRHKAGHYLWIETRGQMMWSADKSELLGFITISRDVTRRRYVEAALMEQRDFLQLVVNSVPDLIMVKDLEGRFQLANTQVAKIYQTIPEDLIGKTEADFAPTQAEAASLREADLETLRAGNPIFAPEEALQERYYQTSKIPLQNPDGSFDRVLVVASDITEHKEAEEALRRAFEQEKELGDLKSRFVSMASHEFRTPLATILAAAETLSAYRQRMTDAQIDHRIDNIRDQVTHLKNIIEDVLQLARIQTGRLEFNPSLMNLDGLCRSVIDEFESRPDIAHQLIYSCDSEVSEVILDKKLMRQIINNLVSNAIKYSPGASKIFISLEYASESLVLSVRDQGIGIPEADLKHLYEPFHRAANVGTISGTGLGLSITKEAVEMHGGTIQVNSQVGTGTLVSVTIPVLTRTEHDHDENPAG